MKVILTQDVKKLGGKGDVVEVAEGYGRNFLLPRGLAKEASSGNLKELTDLKKRQAAKKTKELEEARELAGKISGSVIQISTKAGDNGKLFGSVTNKEIADLIASTFKIEVDKRKVELAETIKTLGNYQVKVKIHPKVVADLTVQVVAE